MLTWWAAFRARPISREREPIAAGAAEASRPGRATRDILIDVSRLVWRSWRGGLPTGVDRVCLAYVRHYRNCSRAVLQRGGRQFVFDPVASDRLFDAFALSPKKFRTRFAALAVRALLSGFAKPIQRGLLYLNVGHTGLNEPSLPLWVEWHGLRAVYFIHDLIPLTHPQYCRPGEGDKHVRRIENVLASASGVIGNSRATIEELRAFAAKRGLPMPPAVAAFIAGPAVPEGLAPAKLERPYFITVGTIEGRKNHILLLRIWERLARRFGSKSPMLIVVGQRGWEAAEALAMLDGSDVVEQHVRELGACADDELASLIAGARALLMPSFAEGFGMPVAEALQLGTPVIASDLAVYREFAGNIPTYLDALDEPGWERAIVDYIGDSGDRRRQRSDMKGYSPPDWQSHFQIVDQWLARDLVVEQP